MLFWNKIDFAKLVKLTLPIQLRKVRIVALLSALVSPLQKLHDETLYTMQHDGRKIYLEKVLNDYFQVAGYNPSDHENTKTVYIENIPQPGETFIYQPEEDRPLFLEPNEVFLQQENESLTAFAFTVFIPENYNFNEPTVRSLVDKYRFIGKLYNIETYEL